jgi:hypothetical protein
MSTAITGNLISLDLTNISSTTSDVDIFSFGSSSGATDTYFITKFAYFPTVDLTNLSFGSPITDSFFSSSIVNLVNKFNDSYIGIYSFTYELVSGTGIGAIYRLFVKQLDTNYTPVSIYIESINQYYYFTENSIIKNSTIAVTSNSELTYNEISNDLQVQPYIIDSINVYANSLLQVDQRWKKVSRNANGVSFTDFNQPRVDPLQRQFAIENISVNFVPSSVNNLGYRLLGLETVRAFFYYRINNQFDLSENKRLEYSNFTQNTPFIIPKDMNTKMNVSIPLIEITKPKENIMSIKDKVAPKIKPREITEAEVFSAFDGVDYKEM